MSTRFPPTEEVPTVESRMRAAVTHFRLRRRKVGIGEVKVSSALPQKALPSLRPAQRNMLECKYQLVLLCFTVRSLIAGPNMHWHAPSTICRLDDPVQLRVFHHSSP